MDLRLDGEGSEKPLTFETWLDGALVLGGVGLEDETLMLSVNSWQRSDLGRALLSEILGRRVGEPSAKTESVEEIFFTRRRHAKPARHPREGASRRHP